MTRNKQLYPQGFDPEDYDLLEQEDQNGDKARTHQVESPNSPSKMHKFASATKKVYISLVN